MINEETEVTSRAEKALTVVVTGAFGSLGNAIANRFAADGHQVARIDFAPAPEGTELTFGGFDLADPVAASDALTQVVQKAGVPSVLINVAGGFCWETLDNGDVSTWERMFRVNALTAASMCKAALP